MILALDLHTTAVQVSCKSGHGSVGQGCSSSVGKGFPQIPVVDSGCADVSVKGSIVVLGSGAVEKAVISGEHSLHTVNEDFLEVVHARAIIHKWTINKSDYVSVGAVKSPNEIYSRQ